MEIEGVVISKADFERFKAWEGIIPVMNETVNNLEIRLEDSKLREQALKNNLERANQKRLNNYNMVLDCRRKLKRYRAMLKGELLSIVSKP